MSPNQMCLFESVVQIKDGSKGSTRLGNAFEWLEVGKRGVFKVRIA